MSPEHWHCWTITNCDKKDICPAGRQSDKECWNVAREMADLRSAMNVCEDCLVYLSRGNAASNFSASEVSEILEKKGVCVLAIKCLDEG